MTPEEELALMKDEVAVKELELRYADALETVHGDPSEEDLANYRTLRDELASTRQAFRLKREQAEARAEEGDVVVRPETVAATAEATLEPREDS